MLMYCALVNVYCPLHAVDEMFGNNGMHLVLYLVMYRLWSIKALEAQQLHTLRLSKSCPVSNWLNLHAMSSLYYGEKCSHSSDELDKVQGL